MTDLFLIILAALGQKEFTEQTVSFFCNRENKLWFWMHLICISDWAKWPEMSSTSYHIPNWFAWRFPWEYTNENRFMCQQKRVDHAIRMVAHERGNARTSHRLGLS